MSNMSLFRDGFPCVLMASLMFLLCQFSSPSRIFTSLVEHWWPVFNLSSLTADRGWRHDSCSLIHVPSDLAVSAMYSVGRSPGIEVMLYIRPHTLPLCLSCLSGAPAGTSEC